MGARIMSRGWFVRPTVFADVRNDMDIAREEIFGPVLAVIAYEDEDEAIANDSAYGLQAYVFSSQPQRARRVVSRLQAGTVLANRMAPGMAHGHVVLLTPPKRHRGQARAFGQSGPLAVGLEAELCESCYCRCKAEQGGAGEGAMGITSVAADSNAPLPTPPGR
jgi:hypothetical protein